jgi:hypothetical protein
MLIFRLLKQKLAFTQQMHHKDNKNIGFKAGNADKNFTEERLTSYTGLALVSKYIHSQGIGKLFDILFPTVKLNATKFSTTQIMLSVVLASMSDVYRMIRIENFTCDPLVQHLLNLKEDIDQDTLTGRLKALGQRGAFSLQEGLFRLTSKMVRKSNLSHITIDCDSTVATVYGNQEGAAKGYNPHKLGANSYHSQLCFCTEMKLILNSWFRTGSAYTSNGICEFMKQTLASLPRKIRRIFFRADSGYFNGELFDLLEREGHDYLVKVKLKNLDGLMLEQEWSFSDKKRSVCSFGYQAKGWNNKRTLRGIRILTGYKETNFFGEVTLAPEYEYFCYCSNLKDKDGKALHELYKERAESENWIEQTKNQLHASQTLTNDFSANDIIWQLAVLGYNLSVMMRYEADSNIWRQEHLTFFRWFINVPGKVVKTARKVTVKMSRHYWYADRWRDFEQRLSTAC